MSSRPRRFACLLACAGALWGSGCGTPTTPAGAAGPGATLPPASLEAPAPGQAARKPDAPAAPAVPTAPLVAPAPVRFEDSIDRAGRLLFAQARAQLGAEPRAVVVDPLIDASTGARTQSTETMGKQLEGIVKSGYNGWTVKPLTRATLAERPLLLIGTLTPVNVKAAIDTPPDAFRVWLSLIDLRTGRLVAKQIDRATVDSVNPEPLAFYKDSPTWTKDTTVLGYINSCQVNTKIGDPADPEYLAHLPAAALINEATLAYDDNKIPLANKLYKEAEPLAGPADLRVLNGLYLTSWSLGQKDAAKTAFDGIVKTGLDLKRLPLKLLFKTGTTAFDARGDLPEQYRMWVGSLAQQAGKVDSCVRVVGHTSRTGSASVNERLSRDRAETVQKMLQQSNRSLGTRLSALGVGSREALVGIGTDDARDALDRRVEFRVLDCV